MNCASTPADSGYLQIILGDNAVALCKLPAALVVVPFRAHRRDGWQSTCSASALYWHWILDLALLHPVDLWGEF